MSEVPPALRTVRPSAPGATRLTLVRHGEARCNVAGVVGGRRGCTGLTEQGMGQAEALRRRLAETASLAGATALYSSVLARARQTAAVIAPAVGEGTLEATEQCDLCELHPGEADAMTWEEFSVRFGEPPWDTDPGVPLAPGGESWSGFVERAAAALEALAGRHPGEHVVVVCHAGVIEAAMLRLLPLDPGVTRLGLSTVHTSLTDLEHAGDWRLLRYNDAAHLGD